MVQSEEVQSVAGYEYYVEFDLTDNVDEDSYGRFFITLTGQHSSLEAEFSRYGQLAVQTSRHFNSA